MKKIASLTLQVTVDVWEDENYKITVTNYGNMFYVLTDLEKKNKDKIEPEKLFEFVKKLKEKYPDYKNKLIIFERKGKIYYYREKKEVDKNECYNSNFISNWINTWRNSGNIRSY